MTDTPPLPPQAMANACEHHYGTHILGGHPIHVPICTICGTPDWNDLAEQAAAFQAPLENRLRLAHQARRAKEHQLDGIRRALCDVGVMEDDDPYGHADLEDVIRQAFADRSVTADSSQEHCPMRQINLCMAPNAETTEAIANTLRKIRRQKPGGGA